MKAVKFILCNLLPPPKKAVLAYLGIPLEPGAKPEEPVPITRKAEVDVSLRNMHDSSFSSRFSIAI
jgi:primary-amine oxidase